MFGEVKTTAIAFRKVQVDNAAASCQAGTFRSSCKAQLLLQVSILGSITALSGGIRLDPSVPQPVKHWRKPCKPLCGRRLLVNNDLVRSRKSNVHFARRKLIQQRSCDAGRASERMSAPANKSWPELDTLKTTFSGNILLPSDEDYAVAIQTWHLNPLLKAARKPRVVLQPRGLTQAFAEA